MRILPEGYMQLEYIESSGTQYIDTGLLGRSGIKIAGRFSPAAIKAFILMGCYSPERFYPISVMDTGVVRYGYKDWVQSNFKLTQNQWYDFEVDMAANSQYLRINGETVASSNIAGSFTNNFNIFVFAYNDGGKAGDYFSGKVGALQFFVDGLLVRDYIPVVGTDGVAGLWDKVEQVFYGNAGTGAFIAGAIIPEEPDVPPRKVTVDLTPPMTGEKTEDFNINYYVIDDIGTESFAVVEYIDGEETQSRTVTASETISTLIESTSMDDGLHTFMLIVDEIVEVEYTFFVNNSTITVNTTGVLIDLPAQVNINEKFLISVVVTELSLTIAKLKIHAGDIYSGEV